MRSIMRFLSFPVVCVFVSLFLSGCLLDSMEKITEQTRDEVHATNDAIHDSENLQKIARMHSQMVDSSVSPSVRNTAAKVILAKYPENFLAQDLGMLLPSFRMGSFKKTIGGAEVELLNVPYVGSAPSRVLGVATISNDLMQVVAFAGTQLVTELEAKTKSPGITAEEMADYRTIAARLVVIVPATLGALKVEPLEQAIEGLLSAQSSGLQLTAFTEQLQSSLRSGRRAVPATLVKPTVATLEQLAVNVSLDEAALNEMRALMGIRLGL